MLGTEAAAKIGTVLGRYETEKRSPRVKKAQAGQVKEMKTEQTNKIPVYRRLADEIKAEILSGKRAPGSVLPSERLMAQQLGVHRNTVAKA